MRDKIKAVLDAECPNLKGSDIPDDCKKIAHGVNYDNFYFKRYCYGCDRNLDLATRIETEVREYLKTEESIIQK